MNESRIRNIAVELFKFTRNEVATFDDDRLVGLSDEGRFSHARESGNTNHADLTVTDLSDGLDQGFFFRFPANTSLGQAEHSRGIGRTDGKGLDLVLGVEGIEAFFEIEDQSTKALVALLHFLLDQGEDNVGKDAGNAGIMLEQSGRLCGQVLIDPAIQVMGDKGVHARQDLVERESERVVIRSIVGRAVHAAGSLRGDEGQGAFDDIVAEQRATPTVFGGDPVVDDLHVAACWIPHEVGRVDVVVNDARFVDGFEFPGQPDQQLQALGQATRHLALEAIQ
nr:hypothetical protein [Sulfidibacter corallicola]